MGTTRSVNAKGAEIVWCGERSQAGVRKWGIPPRRLSPANGSLNHAAPDGWKSYLLVRLVQIHGVREYSK